MLVSLIGLLTPRLTALLFGPVVENGKWQVLAALAVFMISVSVSRLLFQAVNALLAGRVTA